MKNPHNRPPEEACSFGSWIGCTKESFSQNHRKALLFLQQLHERLEDFQVGRVRIVGTDTLRKAKNGTLLLQKAQEIMGCPTKSFLESKKHV